MRRFLSAFVLSLLVSCAAFAQPEIDSWRLYDGGENFFEQLTDIYPRTGGGYYLCGISYDRGWVVRLDEEGNVVWSHRYGATWYSSLIETDNGDIVVCGHPEGMDFTNGHDPITAARINPENGNQIWSHDYLVGWGWAVIELKEGDFVLAGTAFDDQVYRPHGKPYGCLIRINADGEEVWSSRYTTGGAPDENWLYTIRETEGGVVAGGYHYARDDSARGYGHCEGWVLKADLDGEEIWSNIIDQANYHSFRSMVSMPGGFALTGNSCSLTFINAQGELIADNVFNLGNNYGHVVYGLTRTQDGGFCLVGGEQNHSWSPFALRTDRAGRLRWASSFQNRMPPGGAYRGAFNWLMSVIVVGDNQLVACGMLPSEDQQRGSDGLVVRLLPDNADQLIIYRKPEDSLQTVLPGDSIRFVLRARHGSGYEMDHQWFYGDRYLGYDSLTHDTSHTVVFDTLVGDYPVTCRLSEAGWNGVAGWLVRVRDFFIAKHTPDTLNLSVRRGTSVNFSLDSIAALSPGPVDYTWMLTDLRDSLQENAGLDSSLELAFPRLGRYTLDALAYNRESQDEVTWQIAVRSLIFEYYPELLNLTVKLDSTVTFDVFPFDPHAPNLSYRWFLDGDSVGSEFELQQRFSEEGLHLMSGIVSDSTDADTIVWNVTVIRPEEVPYGRLKSPLPRALAVTLSPNPFNARSTIQFALPAVASVTLTLHDLSGRTLCSLANGRFGVGEHQIALDAVELPAGLYFLRLESAGKVKIAKAVVLK
jgi:hypothetical protein